MDTDKSWIQWHGHRGNSKWPLPKLVAKSDEANRADQNNMIKANEYLDSPEVLDAKLDVVVELIKKSENFIAYTGAGLSKASGIPDYATKSKESIVQGPKIKSSLDALPTYAHHVLVALEQAGYLKHWVQQNHDGLPQKAGYPQEKINEIHGAWFDPSNPVVQFSGSLRSDLFQWMLDWEKKADLCFCLGTSLSGMNADRMANTPAKKSLKGKALGTVLINLQQTPLDSMSAIRIWAKLDDAFKILVKKLNIEVKPIIPTIPPGDVYTIPYDENGKKDTYCKMTLDLRDGAEIKIIAPGSMNEGSLGEIRGKRDGNYSVHLNEKGKLLSRLMGVWWVDAALRGALDQLPLVNKKPKVVKAPSITENVIQVLKDITIGEDDSNYVNIVQSHALIDQAKNLHQWALELGPNAEDVVQEVIYNLHPTFKPNVIKVTEAPFFLERTGWGTFPVSVTIVLKDGTKIDAEHKLTFQKSLKVTKVPVPK